MPKVIFDVEVVRQEANPICWIASCAMVKGYGTHSSVGVGDFTGGFDPSNSCIENLAGNWAQCTDLMNTWGFNVLSVSDLCAGSMKADDLFGALNSGPAVLLHLCNGFPYGIQWRALDSGAHAVVITSVDTENNAATFNNPWGDKDQEIDLDVLLNKINADQFMGKSIGFWRA